MGYTGGSFLFVVVINLAVVFNVINVVKSSGSNAHQVYSEFLLANGVALTPPMGYYFILGFALKLTVVQSSEFVLVNYELNSNFCF